jgi:hypothetical protein
VNKDQFKKDVEHAINYNSMENGSDTPDFILAEYLADCLAALDRAMRARMRWYKSDKVTIPVKADPTMNPGEIRMMGKNVDGSPHGVRITNVSVGEPPNPRQVMECLDRVDRLRASQVPVDQHCVSSEPLFFGGGMEPQVRVDEEYILQQGVRQYRLDLETERLIKGRNVHSVYHVCPTHANRCYAPLQNDCVDCKLYLSGADVRKLINEAIDKCARTARDFKPEGSIHCGQEWHNGNFHASNRISDAIRELRVDE